ncbi:MAG: NeuD/PglB/VioB family sugar acetyltransferase [Chitinophaga sp.]|uniref:NeuD/PglB/VioB family sugar acetyltransferase n=1 Tax=Chitinophaga sp. TaxID=1869181 RepID=UPI0025C1968C|nr:NeuD/PglB/VioB family sugar acetyltransferase [Chitinophaga sp.]MBV8252195.1 NeuD/PglB/VioB family sugar acetyltransferase [Chitinophaga sp.]
MKKEVVIYGAGGHARVIASLVKNHLREVSCFFDDQESKQGNVLRYDKAIFPDAEMIIAVGNNTARQRLAQEVAHDFGTFVHPAATVDTDVILGEGTVILANAVVQANVKIGAHVIINAGAVVDHDAIVEDYVHIAPNACIGGGAHIEKGAVIGAGAVVSRFARVKANTAVPPLTVV